MLIHHFTSMTAPRLTARLLSRTTPYGARIILDLEDSVQSLCSPDETVRLKIQARNHARAFYAEHLDLVKRLRVGFRMNAITTAEFEADVETLEQLSRLEPLDCVMLSKVSSADELRQTKCALARVRVSEFVPLVETVEGVCHLQEILQACASAGVRAVLYGHYDYSLDSGAWPFLGQDQEAFWAWVEPIIARIEAAGIMYVHTPYSNLDDDAGFTQVLKRVARRCRRDFGASTLSLRQTQVCASFDETHFDNDDAMRREEWSLEGSLALANHVCETYAANARDGLSFVREPRTGRFIPPHEYQAAVAFLRRMGA